MSYRIEPDESWPQGVRRAAREQADKALKSLSAAHDDPGEAVHDARKRFKKIRAVLRLVRLHIGEEVFDTENVAWRDAGRLLSDAREADAATEVLGLLEDYWEGVVDPDALTDFRRRLEARAEGVLDEATRPGGVVERVIAEVEGARARIAEWPVGGVEVDGLVAGMQKVYRRGHRRMAEAFDEPGEPGEVFHEWRKRVKYLWYHLRLVTPAWPPLLEPHAEEQHELANILGDANDLTDLIELLDRRGDTLLPDPTTRRGLRALSVDARRAGWNDARALGDRLYADSPEAFAHRMTEILASGAHRRAGASD